MKVLITGASGFVGGNFARYALERGFEVYAQYHTRRPASLADAGARCLAADLRAGPPDWPKVDLVVHAATNANAREVPAHDLIEGNVLSTKHVVSWMKAQGVRRVVFCSTISAYGEIRQTLLDEGADSVNTGVYGLTKLLGESLFRESAPEIDCLAVRLPGVLGPGAHGNWLTRVVSTIRAGVPVPIFNPDSLFNNAAHVADLFELVCSFAQMNGAGYDMINVCAGSEMKVRELIEMICRTVGVDPDIAVVPSEKQSFIISAAKATRVYGYRPMRLEAMMLRYLHESGAWSIRPRRSETAGSQERA